jgi:hypothetical protein
MSKIKKYQNKTNHKYLKKRRSIIGGDDDDDDDYGY